MEAVKVTAKGQITIPRDIRGKMALKKGDSVLFKEYPNIRDIDDLPVLANAIESEVDLLITGDKDFEDVIIEKPRIMKHREYITKYIK
jgi:AbrB family looped-hinge helix DNA binding protein